MWDVDKDFVCVKVYTSPHPISYIVVVPKELPKNRQIIHIEDEDEKEQEECIFTSSDG